MQETAAEMAALQELLARSRRRSTEHLRSIVGEDRALSAAEARHLAARPAVSVAYVDGEGLAVFVHGTARRLEPPDGRFGEAVAYLTGHYGMSPLALGPDIRLYRLEPAWMVGWAADRPALHRRLGLGGGPASPTSRTSPAG
ncbi:MAG TPA: hypothetical protein VFN60_01730 [Acidimicrobiales bacterium]|nr:hypothetical protein [Acidimicrobiales bacterium]